MVATVTVSGGFALADTAAIDTFVTAGLGGAAGDAIAVYQDKEGGGVYIICSKA